MQEALLSSVEMLLGEVEGELAEYGALQAGNIGGWIVDDLAALPDMLIRARIASGLTQQQLAQRLDFPEAALERYEDGWYTSAGLDVLVRAAAPGLEVRLTGRLGEAHEAPAAKRPDAVAVAV